MRRFFRRLRRSERGQGMSEYIIIVALIAIAAIGVITIFGESIREIFFASTSALAGDTNVRPVHRPSTRGDYVRGKTLRDFAKKND
jgi:pilus assembly protein Flp/PilA